MELIFALAVPTYDYTSFLISVYFINNRDFSSFPSFPISVFQSDALLTFPSVSKISSDFFRHFLFFLFPYFIKISAISTFPSFLTLPPFSLSLFPYFPHIPYLAI